MKRIAILSIFTIFILWLIHTPLLWSWIVITALIEVTLGLPKHTLVHSVLYNTGFLIVFIIAARKVTIMLQKGKFKCRLIPLLKSLLKMAIPTQNTEKPYPNKLTNVDKSVDRS